MPWPPGIELLLGPAEEALSSLEFGFSHFISCWVGQADAVSIVSINGVAVVGNSSKTLLEPVVEGNATASRHSFEPMHALCGTGLPYRKERKKVFKGTQMVLRHVSTTHELEGRIISRHGDVQG